MDESIESLTWLQRGDRHRHPLPLLLRRQGCCLLLLLGIPPLIRLHVGLHLMDLMHCHAGDPALCVLGGGQGHIKLALLVLYPPGLDEAVVGGSYQAQVLPG